MENFLGIDVGGTKIHAAKVVLSGRILAQAYAPTPVRKDAAISEIVSLAKQLRDSGTRAVGIGVPGPVDFEKQVVRELPNLSGWKNVSLPAIVRKKLGIPVVVDNDAKCFLLAELKAGAAKGKKNVLGVVIGTGIGSAFSVGGSICRGAHGSAGELGHIIVSEERGDPNARNAGSLESLASGEAVRFRALSRLSSPIAVRSKTILSPNGLDSKAVFEAASKGDGLARMVVADTARFLGIGLADAVNVLDPELIVLGGSVASQLPVMLPTLRKILKEKCFEPASGVPIVAHKVRHPGAVGAALLAAGMAGKKSRRNRS